MKIYDIFNGDADGICALHQMRLSEPLRSVLVTGAKRDSRLLSRIRPRRGDRLFVFDISFNYNRDDVSRFLKKGVAIDYFDHHFAGSLPRNALLRAHIDASASQCTSPIVDRHLNGKYRLWALTAAFGDNLYEKALRLCRRLCLKPKQIKAISELGEMINYNAYGETAADLYYHPKRLYESLRPYSNPLDFIRNEKIVARLHENYKNDLHCATRLKPVSRSKAAVVLIQPDKAWSRRVRGVLANYHARKSPDSAVVVITPKETDAYMVSVRTARQSALSAHEFCSRFDTGGGRHAAAGIDRLPKKKLTDFLKEFHDNFGA